jgi:hypothetical protein
MYKCAECLIRPIAAQYVQIVARQMRLHVTAKIGALAPVATRDKVVDGGSILGA